MRFIFRRVSRIQGADAIAPVLLTLFLFGGSWKTAPVFGNPEAWYPTIAIWVPLAVICVANARQLRHHILTVPAGLWMLGAFTFWLAARTYQDETLIFTGVVEAARFLFLPLCLSLAGFLLARQPKFAFRLALSSAVVGGILVVAALVHRILYPPAYYGLASFQENSIVFGWTASLASLALLSKAVTASSVRRSFALGSLVGASIAALVLNGGRGAALAELCALAAVSGFFLRAWKVQSRARLLGWALGGMFSILLVFLAVAAPFPLSLRVWPSENVTAGAPANGGITGVTPANGSETTSNKTESTGSQALKPAIDQTLAQSVIGRTANIQHDPSAALRLGMWRQALTDLAASPLAGQGTGSFRAEVMFAGQLWVMDSYPHNILLEAASETGAIGLVLLVIALASAARATWKASAIVSIGPSYIFLLGGFVFSLVESQLSGDLQMNRNIWIFAGVSWGLMAQLRQSRSRAVDGNSSSLLHEAPATTGDTVAAKQ